MAEVIYDMKCPNCRFTSTTLTSFCTNCGESMPTVCQRCNTANQPGSRQCHQCGVALYKTGINEMQRDREATRLLWTGLALAITAVLCSFIAKVMWPYTYT